MRRELPVTRPERIAEVGALAKRLSAGTASLEDQKVAADLVWEWIALVTPDEPEIRSMGH
jgi:hypothetical protein